MKRRYLGDGVFADFDGHHIVLTAEDGIQVTNRVYLEPGVFAALVKYQATLLDWIAERQRKTNG
jgi:hypothetical protein